MEENKENEENEIKHVLDSLVTGLEKEANDEFLVPLDKMLQKYSHLDVTNPEKFKLFSFFVFDRPMNVLLKQVLTQQAISKDLHHQVGFVYEHYGFLESHLKNVIYEYEGSACSTDKSRWLIDIYLHYLLTDRYDEMKDDKYYHPLIKDVKLWVNWMETMIHLYDGNEKDYVFYKNQLRQKYEAILNQTLTYLDYTFRQQPFFVKYEEDDQHRIYRFEDKRTKDKGAIFLTKQATISYTYHFGEKQRRATYDDILPEWFDLLLKTK